MIHPSGLKVTVQGDREIIMTREFNAPRDLVYKAMSEPELIKRWMLGPPGWAMPICESDQRVGGGFRCVWQHQDGQEMVMRGTFLEIDPPARVVRTESFVIGCEPQSGEQTATFVLTDQGDRTLMTITLVFPSNESRDAMIASGMERGASASYDRLDEVLTHQ